jgi:hypothetical protein
LVDRSEDTLMVPSKPPLSAGQAEHQGAECHAALQPHLDEITKLALASGWTPVEVALALLKTGADQLKDLGYGASIN